MLNHEISRVPEDMKDAYIAELELIVADVRAKFKKLKAEQDKFNAENLKLLKELKKTVKGFRMRKR